MALLEVERKFRFLPELISTLKLNKGHPPFRHLKYRGTSTFRDTYYDSSNILSDRGIWVRKRDQTWEAKRRVRGDLLQTSYEELKCPNEIRSLISRYIPGAPGSSNSYGLGILCDYITNRELYLADEKFSIMLDHADFGHTVGEVELLARDAKAAEEEINEFMEKYKWFFGHGKPKGKISAYLEKYGCGPRARKCKFPVILSIPRMLTTAQKFVQPGCFCIAVWGIWFHVLYYVWQKMTKRVSNG